MKNRQLKTGLILSLMISLFWSCSPKNQVLNSVRSEKLLVYPEAPERARFQYLTTIKNSADVEAKRSKFSEFIVGQKEIISIIKPFSAQLHKGKLYVCDQGAKRLEVFDLEKNAFSLFSPSGRGQLQSPMNCTFDENDNLYVTDVKRHAVIVYNKEGEYLNIITDTGVTKPVDVKVFGDKLYVVDTDGAKVKVYSTALGNAFLYNFLDNNVVEDGKLLQPISIDINTEYVYVCDALEFKVKRYTHDGKYVDFFGGLGKNIGNFARPKGIALDRDKNLFVLDAAFENVQIFNDNKQLLMWFGEHTADLAGFWALSTISIDYDHLEHFQHFVDPGFKLNYLILIANQFGPNSINVYGAVDPLNEPVEPKKEAIDSEEKDVEPIKEN